jgi:hypothetical protein
LVEYEARQEWLKRAEQEASTLETELLRNVASIRDALVEPSTSWHVTGSSLGLGSLFSSLKEGTQYLRESKQEQQQSEKPKQTGTLSKVASLLRSGLSNLGRALGLSETIDPRFNEIHGRLVKLKDNLLGMRNRRNAFVAKLCNRFLASIQSNLISFH